MTIDKTFKAEILKNDGWTYIVWPESVEVFGTRRAVKVKGTMDGHNFQTAFMPWGDGSHRLPLSKTLLKTLGKDSGDTIEVHLQERL